MIRAPARHARGLPLAFAHVKRLTTPRMMHGKRQSECMTGTFAEQGGQQNQQNGFWCQAAFAQSDRWFCLWSSEMETNSWRLYDHDPRTMMLLRVACMAQFGAFPKDRQSSGPVPTKYLWQLWNHYYLSIPWHLFPGCHITHGINTILFTCNQCWMEYSTTDDWTRVSLHVNMTDSYEIILFFLVSLNGHFYMQQRVCWDQCRLARTSPSNFTRHH